MLFSCRSWGNALAVQSCNLPQLFLGGLISKGNPSFITWSLHSQCFQRNVSTKEFLICHCVCVVVSLLEMRYFFLFPSLVLSMEILFMFSSTREVLGALPESLALLHILERQYYNIIKVCFSFCYVKVHIDFLHELSSDILYSSRPNLACSKNLISHIFGFSDVNAITQSVPCSHNCGSCLIDSACL